MNSSAAKRNQPRVRFNGSNSTIVALPLSVEGNHSTRINVLKELSAGCGCCPIPGRPAFRHDEELLLHNDNAALAEACARLLVDDALCIRLGSPARLRAQSLGDGSSMSRKAGKVLERPDRERRRPRPDRVHLPDLRSRFNNFPANSKASVSAPAGRPAANHNVPIVKR